MMNISSLAILACLFFVVAILYSSVGHAGASGYLAAMALLGVAPAIARDPIEERPDILDGILPMKAVVQSEVGFSQTSRAADIWKEQRHPEFVEIIIVARLETRARLALGPAMNADQHGPRTGKFLAVRAIEKTGNLQSIEAGNADQFRLDERLRIQPASFTFRPALEPASLGVQ